MKHKDYIKKMENIIKEIFVEQKKDDTAKIIKNLREIGKEIFGPNSEKERFKWLNDQSRIPVLFGFLKTHIENSPMRPVISLRGGPLEKIGKWLLEKLNIIVKPGEFVLKNTHDLIEKFKEINEKNNREMYCASFNVKAMYPSISIESVIEILHKKLKEIQDVDFWEEFKETSNFFFQGDVYENFEIFFGKYASKI